MQHCDRRVSQSPKGTPQTGLVLFIFKVESPRRVSPWCRSLHFHRSQMNTKRMQYLKTNNNIYGHCISLVGHPETPSYCSCVSSCLTFSVIVCLFFCGLGKQDNSNFSSLLLCIFALHFLYPASNSSLAVMFRPGILEFGFWVFGGFFPWKL